MTVSPYEFRERSLIELRWGWALGCALVGKFVRSGGRAGDFRLEEGRLHVPTPETDEAQQSDE